MKFELKFIILFFVIMSIVAFIMYFIDKRKAIKKKWRIPEATLLTVSFLGGSFGAFAAMKAFRHKTQHAKFYITVPIMLILHIAAIAFAVYKLW